MTDNSKLKEPPGIAAMIPTTAAQLPTDLLAATAQAPGLGVSDDPQDQIIPLITVLQTNSPQCDERGSDYVADAKPGRFWFRNDLVPIREAFDCIPCDMLTVWIEWGPTRGTGLIARHGQQPDDVETRAPQEGEGGKSKLVRRGTGNMIQQSREFFVLVDGKPYVLPFHGTGHTTARQWQTHFHQLRHPTTGAILPAFAHRYHLATVTKQNRFGRWFAVKFTDLGTVSLAEFSAAKELHAIVARGAFRVEMSAADAAQAAA
jgi:hypothetical protein